jgi:transcriptional regulator with XRE-family HTH domain
MSLVLDYRDARRSESVSRLRRVIALRAMLASGKSQREVAPSVGLSQPAIARFEAGGTTPTLPILARIANAFDTTLSIELKPKAVA